MSRKRVNSGWTYFSGLDTITLVTEGIKNGHAILLTGDDLRIDGGGALAGERADYYIERLLIWGELTYTPVAETTRDASRAIVRIGTMNEEDLEGVTENQLWSITNHELWGRILQDDRVACYTDPRDTYNGAALVVDDGVTATSVKNKFGHLGPATFHFDIQTRFSLQRESDQLVFAFGSDNQYYAEGDIYGCLWACKVLVKEYRK